MYPGRINVATVVVTCCNPHFTLKMFDRKNRRIFRELPHRNLSNESCSELLRIPKHLPTCFVRILETFVIIRPNNTFYIYVDPKFHRCSQNSSHIFNSISARSILLVFFHLASFYNVNKKSPWPESANKLYRQNDRCLSAKLVPTFCGYRIPVPYSRFSRPEPLLFFLQVAPQLYSRG
jgi:hypothetical protein